MISKEIIRDRLQTDLVYLTNSRTAFFAVVAENKIRYVVSIELFGDGVSSREVEIEKLEEAGTYTAKAKSVHVGPAQQVILPTEGQNLEEPWVTCEGGTRLYGKCTTGSGTSVPGTIRYYDNDV